MRATPLKLRIRETSPLADGILQVTFESMAQIDLPAWEPGAHVEITLPSGLIRHYSLCGDLADRKTYRIAVLNDGRGRGGSQEVHDVAAAGAVIAVRSPKNNFALEPAPYYLFVAGGIGITPILSMIEKAEEMDVPWRLVYGGRSRSSMAFLNDLLARHPSDIAVFADDDEGRPDLPKEFAAAPAGAMVYACGPTPLLDLTSTLFAENDWPIELRLERFSVAAIDTGGRPFQVELARSHVTVPVAADQTILQVMQAKGLNSPFSCENGYCGSCEAVVLEGEPEHRDTFLSDEEKEDSFTMMICVSRSLGDRLVLDL